MNILKIFHNKRFKNWEICKSCGGKVIFLDSSFLREIFYGDMGTLQCTNCGKEEKI